MGNSSAPRPAPPTANTPDSKVLLAIDTCTRRASIALHDGHTLLAECTWPCERQHTAIISERIRDLLGECALTARDIGVLAVAIGPGSFTGVRCGLAIAKGMAVAGDLPIIGVSAFHIVVHAQPNHGVPIYALVEAGRSRVAVCRYERLEHAPLFEAALSRPNSWQIYEHKAFLETVQAQAWVCGDIPAALLPALQARTSVAPGWLNLRRAGVLADLAYVRWGQGDVDDAATLMPIYPLEGV